MRARELLSIFAGWVCAILLDILLQLETKFCVSFIVISISFGFVRWGWRRIGIPNEVQLRLMFVAVTCTVSMALILGVLTMAVLGPSEKLLRCELYRVLGMVAGVAIVWLAGREDPPKKRRRSPTSKLTELFQRLVRHCRPSPAS